MGDATNLLARVNLLRLDDDSSINDTDAMAIINEAQNTVAKETGCMDESADQNSVAGQDEYDMPAAAYAINYILYYDGSKYKPLKYMPFKKKLQLYDIGEGVPTHFSLRWGKKKFVLLRTPSSSGTNYIRVYFVEKPTAMVITTQETCDLPIMAHEAIVQKSLAMIAEAEGRDESIAKWERGYLREKATVLRLMRPKGATYMQSGDSDE